DRVSQLHKIVVRPRAVLDVTDGVIEIVDEYIVRPRQDDIVLPGRKRLVRYAVLPKSVSGQIIDPVGETYNFVVWAETSIARANAASPALRQLARGEAAGRTDCKSPR